jgi:hypothetical protein
MCTGANQAPELDVKMESIESLDRWASDQPYHHFGRAKTWGFEGCSPA